MTKRSTQVEIAFVSAVAAAALAGCNAQDAYRRDWEQCVNKANVVVEDRLCAPGATGQQGGYYHWLYSRRPYRMGNLISDGYLSPLDRSSIARASHAGMLGSNATSSVTRGGFGSSAHFGSGG